jgi:hypothetical protein
MAGASPFVFLQNRVLLAFCPFKSSLSFPLLFYITAAIAVANDVVGLPINLLS